MFLIWCRNMGFSQICSIKSNVSENTDFSLPIVLILADQLLKCFKQYPYGKYKGETCYCLFRQICKFVILCFGFVYPCLCHAPPSPLTISSVFHF